MYQGCSRVINRPVDWVGLKSSGGSRRVGSGRRFHVAGLVGSGGLGRVRSGQVGAGRVGSS